MTAQHEKGYNEGHADGLAGRPKAVTEVTRVKWTGYDEVQYRQGYATGFNDGVVDREGIEHKHDGAL